ncbi:hypothetical protein HO999_03570 [Streptococcus suis]|nr:hypothetical protein [Streptococcus suis]NQN71895.1 hypothetical protein [Streptococcus suis]NQN73779.1 hypothetical protein [Streptococcus suis]NQN78142.1 hypothetical protein [Streptococcus suis]
MKSEKIIPIFIYLECNLANTFLFDFLSRTIFNKLIQGLFQVDLENISNLIQDQLVQG